MYRCTQEKLQYLRDKGYDVVEIWACERRKLKQARDKGKGFLDGLHFVDPLVPRDAFCGERTNAVKLYHLDVVENGEPLKYYDFTSPYLWVNKNAKFPVGHPEIISQQDQTKITKFFGLAKYTVLPPGKLFHPVLPMKPNGKLTFPPCAVCLKEQMTKSMLEPAPMLHSTKRERVSN